MTSGSNDLFTPNRDYHQGKGPEPLASRMRPRNLEEFAGQDHILAPGRLLRRAIEADQLSSVIFSGPPGTGKTTLARIIAAHTKSRFKSINAVLSGVKEIREAIEEARQDQAYYQRRTILFIDEVHRWNKAQQDALLPWVENGTVILIGATTENPFFEVNQALVSRSRIFQLKSLEAADLRKVMEQTLKDPVRGYGSYRVSIDEDAAAHLISAANGDARSLLGAIELAVETSVPSFPPEPGTLITIDLATAEESIQQKAVLYDKSGDYHYDTISAFIKSLRGSDPDAALYWLARMVHAGESPRFIFRRMLISAAEDVGLADPSALLQVQAAAEAFDRVGLPEGQFFLAQAALYLATAAKSNSSLGYFDALQAIKQEQEAAQVPNHLRDSSRDKEGFGHGEGYQYPHAFAEHWVAQNYLPESMRGRVFYHGGSLGYEGQLQETVMRRRELQLEAESEPFEEILSFSGSHSDGGRSRSRWIERSEGSASATWEELRGRVFDSLGREAGLARHSRILICGKNLGPFAFEALRRCPEGLTALYFLDRDEEERFRYLVSGMPRLEAPLILSAGDRLPESDIVLLFNAEAGSGAQTGPTAPLGSGAAAGSENGTAPAVGTAHLGGAGPAPAVGAASEEVERLQAGGSRICVLEPALDSQPALSGWLMRAWEAGILASHSGAGGSASGGASSGSASPETEALDIHELLETFADSERRIFTGVREKTPTSPEKHKPDTDTGPAPWTREEHIQIRAGRIPSPAQIRSWFANSWYRRQLENSLGPRKPEILLRLALSAAEYRGPGRIPDWMRSYRLIIRGKAPAND